MIELTLITLIVAIIFYVLHLFSGRLENYHRFEINVMSCITAILALVAVLQDPEILDEDLIYFLIPIFYAVVTSAISFTDIAGGRK